MPEKYITQFMWGFQHLFRTGVEMAAADVLTSVEAKTEVEVYLVGFRATDGEDPICIEPEDGYFTPEQMRTVAERGAALYEEHPRSRMLFGAPHLNVRIHAELRDTCRAVAVKEVLESQHPADFVFFVGNSAVVGDYEVHTTIGVARSYLELIPALQTTERDGIRIAPSLVASAINELLGEARKALRGPDPGSDVLIDRPGEEMARSAARRFVQSMGVVAGYPYGTPLFEVLNEVSIMHYEQRAGRGRMLLVQPASGNVEALLILSKRVPLGEHRTLRKLLELSSVQGMALLTDGNHVYALGSARADRDLESETLFSITISEHGTWEIEHSGKRLLQVRYGRPVLPGHQITRERFTDIASRIFGASTELDAETLWEVAQAASEAEHGTMIVVSESAGLEAERLGGQALRVEETKVTLNQVRALTAIDGALLFEPSGTLRAIGVILDGIASTIVEPSRGARFNSAIRYLSSTSIPTIILLVSEDGMINLLPDLRERISRRALTELFSILNDEAGRVATDAFDAQRFNNAYLRLEERRFYLSADQCTTINALRKQVEQRKTDPYEIRIIRGDLAPHQEMNDSYFYD